MKETTTLKDFQGRIIGRGDQSSGLIYRRNRNEI